MLLDAPRLIRPIAGGPGLLIMVSLKTAFGSVKAGLSGNPLAPIDAP
jgi:hypothetical protein